MVILAGYNKIVQVTGIQFQRSSLLFLWHSMSFCLLLGKLILWFIFDCEEKYILY